MTRNRDEKGRFLPGNTVGKGHGRPPKERERKYMERFKKAVTLSGFEEATRAVLKMAREGDVRAWTVLAQYALGKPVTRIEAEVDQRSLGLELHAAITKVFGGEEEEGDVIDG